MLSIIVSSSVVLGHVLMVTIAKYEMQLAIDECKYLTNPTNQYLCATGAYMEYLFENDDFHIAGLAPCDSVTDFPAACYRYLWQRLVKGIKIRDANSVCTSLSTAIHRQGK